MLIWYLNLTGKLFLFLQLVVGDFGLNYEQSKAQFGLWSVLAAVSSSISQPL